MVWGDGLAGKGPEFNPRRHFLKTWSSNTFLDFITWEVEMQILTNTNRSVFSVWLLFKCSYSFLAPAAASALFSCDSLICLSLAFKVMVYPISSIFFWVQNSFSVFFS